MRSRRSANRIVGDRTSNRPVDSSGWWRLLAVSIAVAVTWMMILPTIAVWPDVAAQREANRVRGINPGAMYYTELRAMPALEAELRQRIDRDRRAVWSLRR